MVRVKQRYILAEVQLGDNSVVTSVLLDLTSKSLQSVLKNNFQDLYGDLGAAAISSNFVVKFWNPSTKVLILRVGREHEVEVSNSLILLNSLSGQPCRIRILHVSGTLQKAEERMKLLNESWLSGQGKQIEEIEHQV
jgi:ribonuclease P/MRP protein subunit POP5